MAGMDKVRSLQDAISADVQDGMSIAMGSALESLIPFAGELRNHPPEKTKSDAHRPDFRYAV